MTWVTPLHTFTCGACATKITALASMEALTIVMRTHAEVCPGSPPLGVRKPTPTKAAT